MLDRFGITGQDRRNLVIVAVVVALILVFLSDGPVAARLVVGVVGAVVSAISFLLMTIVFNAIKPDYW